MKKVHYLSILVAILVIGSLIVFWPKKPNYLKPTSGENIIVFGDSLVAGNGSTAGNDLVSNISRQTGFKIINAGVPGDTTQSALMRIEKDVLSKNPKVVIIILGGNDFLQRIPTEQTVANMTEMLDKILNSGSGAILVSENRILKTTKEFKKIAKQKNIPYIADILGPLNSSEKADSIHPNDSGYEIISSRISPVLKDYLYVE